MRVILVGLMGSGKSSVGRVLAETLGRPFVDTDAEIEKTAGMTIPEIFAAQGEAGFRVLESNVITRVVTLPEAVVATGGGAVLAPGNREALRSAGRVFWLDAPPEVLLERAAAEGIARRPLLFGADPLGRLRALAEERAPIYAEAAHHRVGTAGRSTDEVAAVILQILKEMR